VKRERKRSVHQVTALGGLLLLARMAPLAADPGDIAVVVNEADPYSRQIARYYVQRRGIPEQNVIAVRIPPDVASIDRKTFADARQEVLRRTPAKVQFYALTWAKPYRVDCMSITSAMTFGFDPAYCAAHCEGTRVSPYFGSGSQRPWDDLGLRPAMAIAAEDVVQARALIDRGVSADGGRPGGTAYLVRTGDAARDVRAALYADAVAMTAGRIPARIESTRGLRNREDVLFYFTGAAVVPDLATNHFVAGAVGDHLTSAGGVLDGHEQMSVLRWIDAGATGSYGTVVEPCNIVSKFPNPGLMMDRYLAGETLIEAYWKSVAMPGQGIFVGEPLARPFAKRAEP
jgi:uncharacterized protein (TIGR03790 family)